MTDKDTARHEAVRVGHERRATRPVAAVDDIDVLRRRLHDTTLQTLEYIANAGAMGDGADLQRLVQLAAREATDLRYLLEGVVTHDPKTLEETLSCVVEDARAFADHHIDFARGPMDGSLEHLTVIEIAGAVREALTNARKHADASRVVVYAEEHRGAAVVTVRDDGRGTDLTKPSRGLGIAHSIRGRCSRLGAHSEITSSPGEGFRVTLQFGGRPDCRPHE